MIQLSGPYGRSIAPATLSTQDALRIAHLNPAPIALKRLSDITLADCQEWVDGLRATKRKKVEGKIVVTKVKPSPHTVKRCATFLSKLFTLAIHAGHISTNPLQHVILPRAEPRENRVLSIDEALRLLNPSTRIDAIMTVAILCGLRRAELQRLRWADVDARKSTLTTGVKTKAGKGRVVPVTPIAMEAIQAQPRTGPYVFGTENGGMMRLDNIGRDFKARRAELGLPDTLRLHDLRGSFISFMIESGADVRAVMEIVGHRSPETTLKFYARSNMGAKTAAVAAMSAMLVKSDSEDRVTG